MADWDGQTSDDRQRQLRFLRGLCQDIVELRRGDHSAARLKIEQERHTRERRLAEKDHQDQMRQYNLTPEERAARIREIYGRPPLDPPTPATQPNPEVASVPEESN